MIDMRFWAKTFFVPGIVVSMLTLAGCAKPPEPRTACALSDGEQAATVNLTAPDCGQVQAALADQQRAQQAAAAQAADTERQKAVQKYRADVAAQMRGDEGKGYKTTSIENFKLNGQDLAHHDAKVAVQGVYVKTTRGEFLMPSSLATSQVDVTRTPDEGVNLLSRSASRSAKRSFTQCQKDSVKSKLGCPMTILGEAVLCERTTIFGMAQAPCIAVDDSWYIPPPG
ncbi:MAG TPA: hypothetical protein VGF92_16470 [Stellaceae bacterium]|jgi:hypothetical protein